MRSQVPVSAAPHTHPTSILSEGLDIGQTETATLSPFPLPATQRQDLDTPPTQEQSGLLLRGAASSPHPEAHVLIAGEGDAHPSYPLPWALGQPPEPLPPVGPPSRPHPVEHPVSKSQHLGEGVEPAVQEGEEDEEQHEDAWRAGQEVQPRSPRLIRAPALSKHSFVHHSCIP